MVPNISRFSDQQVTSIKIAVASKEGLEHEAVVKYE